MTFDTFGWTAIVILQAITFDSWTIPMYGVISSSSSSLPVFYFILIIVVGGFFIVNLFLAVLFQVRAHHHCRCRRCRCRRIT